MPKTVEVIIEGISPLLQARMTAEDIEGLKKKTRKTKNIYEGKTPREVAETRTYCIDRENQIFGHPASSITNLLTEAGKNHRDRSTRRSLARFVPGAVNIPFDDEWVTLCDKKGSPISNWEVDERTGVNQAIKARILLWRPRWETWCGKFLLVVDEEVLEEKMIRQLLMEGGKQIGIGAFRPEKGGPFGKFHVIQWKVISDIGNGKKG